jgi:anti-anti-sigma regulatory factor
VVFSLFGRKKKTENKDKAAIARQPVKPSPEKSATSVASPQTGEDSLDFSAYVPPPNSEPRAEAVPVVPPAAPAAPAQQEAAPSSPVEMPAAAPVTPSLPTERSAHPSGPDAAAEIGAAEVALPIIEEAATLFANGQDEQALYALSRSVREGEPGNSVPQAWLMLIDLYQHLGMRAEFEEAAVNYAVTFEVSPPSWESQPGAEAADQALILSGELSGASETLAKQLQDRAVANKMLVIDMSRATRVDLVTAGLMLKVLSALRETGTTIQIRGANELIRALFGVTGLGKVARIIPRKIA